MRKVFPLLLLVLVGVCGAIFAGVMISDARPRKAPLAEPARAGRDLPPEARPSAIRAKEERVRAYTQRHVTAPAAPPPKFRPIVQETFDEWVRRNGLTTEQQQQIHVAIQDASVNHDRAERAALSDAIHVPSTDTDASWAEFSKVSRMAYTAPELFADIERIAGKPAAADFEEEFGPYLGLLFYQPTPGVTVTYDQPTP